MHKALAILAFTTLLLLISCTEAEWNQALCSGTPEGVGGWIVQKAYCWGKGIASDVAESAVDYKAMKDKASGFGFTECGAGKDYYAAGTCMTEKEFDAFYYGSQTYAGKGGCKHPKIYRISDGGFGDACVDDIEMRKYLERSGKLPTQGAQPPSTTTTEPTTPECKTNNDCPSYCRGASTVVGQTCANDKCVDAGAQDCTSGGQFKYTTCVETGGGAACSQHKQCQVASDCGDGKVSVCASEGGQTKYTYNCKPDFTCETFIVSCPADFGTGSVCRGGGCT
ncbi:hypothetical protein HY641_04525 [Candidatus Woesearchaeota archaeon]|nr:hypothetical protein [Candidatus Woesearchaeota archaeon]